MLRTSSSTHAIMTKDLLDDFLSEHDAAAETPLNVHVEPASKKRKTPQDTEVSYRSTR